MDPVFVPGLLAHLVSIQYAEALNSQEWAAGLEAGPKAARALESEADAAVQRAATEQADAFFREQAAKVPKADEHPNLADHPEYKRQLEVANGVPQADPNPTHVYGGFKD